MKILIKSWRDVLEKRRPSEGCMCRIICKNHTRKHFLQNSRKWKRSKKQKKTQRSSWENKAQKDGLQIKFLIDSGSKNFDF